MTDIRSYWCNNCEAWRDASRDQDGEDPEDSTWTCETCGEGILCDYCGTEWTEGHDESQHVGEFQQ